MTLWNESAGAPVFVATPPPWHPLTLLAERIAPEHASALIPLAAGLLSALALAWLLGSSGVRRATAAAAALLLGIGIALFPPGLALLGLGIAGAVCSFEWLARKPSRARFALAAAAVAMAILGASGRHVPWLLVLAAWPLAALFRKSPARHRAAAAVALAIVAALLSTAFWWLPGVKLAGEGRDFEASRQTSVRHAPRFVAVSRHIVIRDPERAEAAARAIADSRSAATVDHVPAKILSLAGGTIEPAGSPRAVALESYENGRASVGVGDGGWALLVTSEPWWPGWRVYWNGERLPPVTVNAAFVGTFVPPGAGTVELRYRPDSFDDGLRVGGLGFLLVAGALAWPWFLKIPERERVPRPGTRWRRPAIVSSAARRVTALLKSLPRFARASALSLLALYALFLASNGTAVAGGSDTSGYMNHARLLLAGSRVVPLELPLELRVPPSDFDRFLPLGFAPGVTPGTIVPSYPPGVPFHLALIEIVLGAWALRLFAPLAGLAAVVLMYVLAREVGFARAWAFWSAAVLGLFPTFLMFSVTIMSDVAATAWSLAAMIGALRARRSPWWGVLAGCALGVSVLVRPTQVLLLPALVLAIGLHGRSLLAFALGGIPFAAIQVATGQALWGGPLRTGYGELRALVSIDYFAARFSHYAQWLASLLSPLIFPAGLAGLAVASVERRQRVVLALWFAPFLAFYSVYFPYESWWYTRFLMPALPALILLAFFAARAAAAKIRPERRVLFLGVLLAIVLATEIWHDRDKQPWRMGTWARDYPRAIAMAESKVGDRPIVLGMQHSGAFAYYRGETMVRWDMLSPDDFERLRGYASIGGRTWYALLADFEVAEAFRRAPGNWVPIARSPNATLYGLRP